MDIVVAGYESEIRALFGVDELDLPDDAIQQRAIIDMAVLEIKTRVPAWASIEDESDLLRLQNAVNNYACYLLCPSMDQRLNYKVKTMDTSWEKQKTDWEAKAARFLDSVATALTGITTVEIDTYTPTLVGIISNTRVPIGEVDAE